MRDVRKFYEQHPSFMQRADGTGVVQKTDRNDIITWHGRHDAVSTVPNWKGEYYIPTPYVAWRYLASGDPFEYTYRSLAGTRYRKWGITSETDVGGADLPNYRRQASFYPVVSGSLISRAESSVDSKIRGNDWDLAQSIAELPESVGFIVNTFKKVIDVMSAIKRRDPAALARALGFNRKKIGKSLRKGTAQAWLAWQFAVIPLLNDIYEVVKAITDGFQFDPSHCRASSSCGGEVPPLSIPNRNVLTWNFNGKEEVTVSISYRIKSPHLYTLDRLGITSPLGLAWNLLPMSFVVDWFLPVGNFLRSLNQPIGLVFVNGFRTTYMKWSLTSSTLSKSEYAYSGRLPTYRATSSAMGRAPYTSFPTPVPQFRGIDDLTAGKVTSLLALAAR